MATALTMWVGWVDAAGTTSKILLHSNRDGNFDIFIMDDDGGNVVNLTAANDPLDRQDKDPVFCGNKIVYASDRDSAGTFDLWIMNKNGSNPVNLTPNTAGSNESEAHCQADVLLPEIVFRREVPGGSEPAQIWKIRADGTQLSQLTDHDFDDVNPQWCGTDIIFLRNHFEGPVCTGHQGVLNPGEDWQIYLMGAEGELCHTCEPARKLTCAHNADNSQGCGPTDLDAVLFYWPTCRVDAQGNTQIAASAYTIADYSPRNIVRFTLCDEEEACCVGTAAGITWLTDDSEHDSDFPAWSTGGAQITFASEREDLSETTDWEIYKMNSANGSDLAQLTTNGVVGQPAGANEDADPHWGEKSD